MKSRLEQYLESRIRPSKDLPFYPASRTRNLETTPADKGEMAGRRDAHYNQLILKICDAIDEISKDYDDDEFDDDALEQIFSDVRNKIMGY